MGVAMGSRGRKRSDQWKSHLNDETPWVDLISKGAYCKLRALETDRISFTFSFSGPKLQICQFRACFVFVFSFLGLFRFRPSFVFGLLWFSAYPKLQQVFVSCKPSRIFCVQPLKLRRARDQGRVSHWLRRNLSKLQSCEIPFAQRLRKLGPTSAARESALSSVA